MQLFKLSLIAVIVALGASLSVLAMEKEPKKAAINIKLKTVDPNSAIAQLGKKLEPTIALAYGAAKADKENPQPRRAVPIARACTGSSKDTATATWRDASWC